MNLNPSVFSEGSKISSFPSSNQHPPSNDDLYADATINSILHFNIKSRLKELNKKNKHPQLVYQAKKALTRSPSPDLTNDSLDERCASKPKLMKKTSAKKVLVKPINTLVSKKMRLVSTDSVYIDLSRIRTERKGAFESRYELVYLMGIGSYGKVYKICDINTNEEKAVKIISKSKCHTMDKYNEEIEILKKLVSS